MTKNPEILIHDNLLDYFRTLVTAAMRNQQMATTEDTEFYLVNLLADFQNRNDLAARCPNTGEEEPMAITYLRAVQSKPSEKFSRLKWLGDLSLYLSGIFTEHLEATAVGLDYYMALGGNAYTQVADHVGPRNTDLQGLFRDLSVNFNAFTDVLSEVGESAGMQRNSDLLRIYERWLKTGSDRAARQLTRAGIPLNAIDPQSEQ